MKKLIRITSKTCRACMVQNEILRRILPEFPNLEVQDIDYDEEEQVREYDIHGVPFLKLGDSTLTGAHTMAQTRAFLRGELSDKILEEGIANPHYLDNAATTPVCPEAVEAATAAMTENYGNPSSAHYAGRKARQLPESARKVIADSLNAEPEEIFFTSCGSESDNWAILKGALLTADRGKHIISSSAEHDAVRKSLAALAEQGYEITLLTPDETGKVSPAAVKAALRPDTALVSLMLVNNETGAVNDIAGISAALKAENSPALLHTDAVQGYMKLPVDVKTLGADLISLSGHKINAPKGIGALYVRNGLALPPFILGGGQEFGRRAGTESVPLIAAFGAAVQAWSKDEGCRERMAALKARLLEALRKAVPDMDFIPADAPHILNVSLPIFKSQVIINYLSDRGIYVSASSACKKGARSHVLEAIGKSEAYIDSAIRISLSRMTREEDIEALLTALCELSRCQVPVEGSTMNRTYTWKL